MGRTQKDILFGLLMAISIAGVSNTLQLLVSYFSINTLVDKVFIIACLFLGAALIPPIIFGIKYGQTNLRKTLITAALPVAGVMAAAYFIAVVGLNLEQGIGAGLAELIDSGMSPIFYLLIVVCCGVARLSWHSVLGIILIGASMLNLLFELHSEHIHKLMNSSTEQGLSILLALSLLGSLGTAISIWLFRRLIRFHGVSLGGGLFIRYGAPSLIFFLLWMQLSKTFSFSEILVPSALALTAGAILISAVFLSVIRIESEVITASSVALVPMCTVAMEIATGMFMENYTILRADDWHIAVSFGLAFLGTLILNFDPAHSKC